MCVFVLADGNVGKSLQWFRRTFLEYWLLNDLENFLGILMVNEFRILWNNDFDNIFKWDSISKCNELLANFLLLILYNVIYLQLNEWILEYFVFCFPIAHTRPSVRIMPSTKVIGWPRNHYIQQRPLHSMNASPQREAGNAQLQVKINYAWKRRPQRSRW